MKQFTSSYSIKCVILCGRPCLSGGYNLVEGFLGAAHGIISRGLVLMVRCGGAAARHAGVVIGYIATMRPTVIHVVVALGVGRALHERRLHGRPGGLWRVSRRARRGAEGWIGWCRGRWWSLLIRAGWSGGSWHVSRRLVGVTRGRGWRLVSVQGWWIGQGRGPLVVVVAVSVVVVAVAVAGRTNTGMAGGLGVAVRPTP